MAVLVPARMFTVSQVITNPGAVTNLNLQAAATKPFVVVRVLIELAQATIPTDGDDRGTGSAVLACRKRSEGGKS